MCNFAKKFTISRRPWYVGTPRLSCAIRIIGDGKTFCNDCLMFSCSEGLFKTYGFTITTENVTPCSFIIAPSICKSNHLTFAVVEFYGMVCI